MTQTTQTTGFVGIETLATANLRASPEEDEDYRRLHGCVYDALRVCVGPLFLTDVDDLFERYLWHLPADRRQHYNCNTCRQFVERFGGLASITATGDLLSAFWERGPGARVLPQLRPRDA